MFLSDIIVESSEAALRIQSEEGSFPPGRNGPYRDEETPVRNTGHWIITLLKAFEITGDEKFKRSALLAVEYLLSPPARPMNATFFCRRNPDKDFCNGLVGQAWAIEALSVAGVKLQDSRCIEAARDVFMLHPFDRQAGLWKRVNVDGSHNSFDMTFNHQLWFAASGAMLGDGAINSEIAVFIDRAIKSHLGVSRSGRIIHAISRRFGWTGRAVNLVDFLRGRGRSRKRGHEMAHKEIGYHAFNMYAFAILKQYMPQLPLWREAKFFHALEFMNKNEFFDGLEKNIYGYPYNPPGFEVSFTIQEFSWLLPFSRSREWWVTQQLKRCYDPGKKMMSRCTEDEETLSARIYEATRLEDMEIELA